MVHIPSIFRYPILKTGFLLTFLVSASFSQAQYYNLGQDPASIQWRQIKTDHFKLIYPTDFEKNAQYLANLFQYVYQYGTITLANKPSRVPIVVHNRDIIPNAFTLWAPKRIELYTCPPQNSYSQNWLEQLAIHEYRHIVQMDMVNHGFTKALNLVFGEQATAALTGFYIPMWFMEGDAVCTETALSHSGRGRIPGFEMELRAQVLQKGIFSYDKAVLGSYADHVPDQYILGYQIVANTRKNYGYQSWIKAMDFVARQPYLITPLNKGLKRATGMSKVELYKKTLLEMDSIWKAQDTQTSRTPLKILTRNKSSVYTKYKYPHYVNDSLVIAERSSIDDISRFVLIDPRGDEKRICTPGFFSSDVFSVYTGTGFAITNENKPGAFTIDNISINNGLMAWTEREADPRWQNRNYSVIRLYDFSTSKTRTLTHRSRLFVPALSPNGNSLLAVKVSEANKYSMVMIDLKSGSEYKTILSSEDDFFMTPSWSADGKKIVFIILNQSGKSIWTMDIESNSLTRMLDPTFTEISNPKFAGKYVLFNGAFSGIDNIYALDTLNHSVYQVTSSSFGAYDPEYSTQRNSIVYTDYSAEGYRIAETGFTPASWVLSTDVKDYSASLYKQLLKDEPGIMDSSTITHQHFESSPYRKIAHLFNFHSWAPAYFNYEKSETAAGVSFMSQNALSTATTIIGYDWDYSGKAGLYRLTYKYEGWFPILDLDATYGKQAYQSISDERSVRNTWDETVLSGGLKLPLVFSKGKFYTGIQLLTHATWQQIRNNTSADSLKIEGTYSSMEYGLFLYHYIKQAQKDVYPKWGQTLTVHFKNSPFSGPASDKIAAVESYLYFPGIFRHNGCKVYAGFQKKWNFGYPGMYVNYPRGTMKVENEKIMSLQMNYKFPFWYPDASLGPLFYFKRVKSNLFYDYATVWSQQQRKHFSSLGAEVTTDVHFLRFLLPFDLGIREGYRIEDKGWFTDFLFLINLNI